MTSPDFVQFYHRPVAIVTDAGGMLCHAAIISREMEKPCVVGTERSTKVFKDGDLVEVDAEKGTIKRLK
jgi:pyruvate,water dikinase